MKRKSDETKSTENVVTLSQKAGRPFHVRCLSKSIKKEPALTHQNVLAIQSSLGISGRKTAELAKNLRCATKNRKVVEPGLENVLKERIHKLDEIFSIKEDSNMPIVFCNNVSGCIYTILKKKRHIC